MTSLYVDTSALIKTYVAEEFSDECKEIIAGYKSLIISQIGVTETLINLRKRLSIREYTIVERLFEVDIAAFSIIDLDEQISYSAVDISEGTNLATLDAIHLASALSLGTAEIDFLTYDKTQGKAAKSLGLGTPYRR